MLAPYRHTAINQVLQIASYRLSRARNTDIVEIVYNVGLCGGKFRRRVVIQHPKYVYYRYLFVVHSFIPLYFYYTIRKWTKGAQNRPIREKSQKMLKIVALIVIVPALSTLDSKKRSTAKADRFLLVLRLN